MDPNKLVLTFGGYTKFGEIDQVMRQMISITSAWYSGSSIIDDWRRLLWKFKRTFYRLRLQKKTPLVTLVKSW